MDKESTPTTFSASMVKNLVSDIRFADDPDLIFEDVSCKLAKIQETPDTIEKRVDVLEAEGKRLAMAAGIGSQYSIVDAVDKQYSPLVVSFARQLIEEYNCRTPSEIAMTEMVAVDYIHFIQLSRQAKTFKLNQVLDKAIDKAHRQFISALGTLRQMKAPPVSVNVITRNAFVAQNQQINTNRPHESI